MQNQGSPTLNPTSTVPNGTSLTPNSNSALAESISLPNTATPSVGPTAGLPNLPIPEIVSPNSGASLSTPPVQDISGIINTPISTPPSSGDLVNYIDTILHDLTTPNSQGPKSGVGNSGIGTQEVQETDGSSFADQPEYISPDSPSTQVPSGHHKEMKVFHSFDNNINQDLSLRHIGDIRSVVAESKTTKDGLFSTDYAAKHYTITFSRNYRSISVDPGDWTGGGREDSGITVARIEKQKSYCI